MMGRRTISKLQRLEVRDYLKYIRLGFCVYCCSRIVQCTKAQFVSVKIKSTTEFCILDRHSTGSDIDIAFKGVCLAIRKRFLRLKFSCTVNSEWDVLKLCFY